MSSLFTALAQVTVIVAVMSLPWLFGGVQESVQVWFVGAVAVSLGFCLLPQLRRDAPNRSLPSLVLILLLALGLGFFQTLPLPSPVLAKLSPASETVWRELLPDAQKDTAESALPESGSHVAGRSHTCGTISVYPGETQRRVTLLAAILALFLLGALLFDGRTSVVVLFVATAANGAALAFWGIVQQLTWNGKLYGVVALDRGGAPFASFVNRNNAGGYLLLCLASALGLTLWLFSKGVAEADSLPTGRPGSAVRFTWQHGWGSVWNGVLEFVSTIDARRLAALLTMSLLVGGLLLSLSRGAWLAGLSAMTLTVLAVQLARSRQRRAWLPMLAILAALWLVGWLGQADVVRQRFGTLLQQDLASNEGRLKHWQDSLAAARDFPLLGAGLGTYRFAYRPYQHRPDRVLFYHAENQYLEALVEGGLFGLVLMLAAIVCTGWIAWRLLQLAPRSTGYLCGLVGLFALTGQAGHGCFDFGLSIPANAALLAVLCGAIAGRAAQLADGRRSVAQRDARPRWPETFWPTRSPAVAPVGTVVFLAVLLAGLPRLQAAAEVQDCLRRSQFQDVPDALPQEVLTAHIQCLQRCLAAGDPSAEGQQRLALLQIQRYRQQAWEQACRHPRHGPDKRTLWENTSPLALHAWLTLVEQANRSLELEEFRGSEPVRTDLRSAVAHLRQARNLCPILPDPHLLLAELELVTELGEPATVHLTRLRSVAGGSTARLLEAGSVAYQAGEPHLAADAWRRVAELAPSELPRILNSVVGRGGDLTELERLLPNSPSVLVETTREHFRGPEQTALRELLLARAESSLADAALTDEQRHYLLGLILAERNEPERAIGELTRAIQLCPENAAWRYELAQLLESQGRREEARRQAGLSSHLAPEEARYESFLRELIRKDLTSQ